ncbi:hypothetical protein [Niallia taxi]|nr:hypothetical protein [Niallia taxi]MCT2345859.1 hypothetical protein [Niallia taxi]MED3962664.1 hypothetical protein [Niallia taxi]
MLGSTAVVLLLGMIMLIKGLRKKQKLWIGLSLLPLAMVVIGMLTL